MGRYALRSACRDECTCGGVKHGRIEKKADQVVKNIKKKNAVASKIDEKEKEKDKKVVPIKPRRKTTIAAKSNVNTVKDVESKYTMETRSRRKTMMATKIDVDEEEMVVKPKANGRRKTVAPKRKSTAVKNDTVEEKKKIVKTKKDTVVKKKDTMEVNEKEKGDTVEEKNIDWQSEEHTQSIIEDDVTMKVDEITIVLNDTMVVEEEINRHTKNENQSNLRGDGDEETKQPEKRTVGKTEPSLQSIAAPLQEKRRSVKKLELKFDLVLESTPVHRFAAPIKDKMNETRKGGEWDTTDEEMLNDTSQLPPFDLTYPIGDINDDESMNLTDILCDMTDYETVQLREKKVMEQLEDEIEEIEKHHINPRAIIDQLTAENLKLRRTIFELKNK